VIALVVVRDGVLPLGAEEAVAEGGGRAFLAGSGTAAAAAALEGAVAEVTVWEAGAFRPGSWAATLAPVLEGEDVVVLPASADGRDLAPRLALAAGRELAAPCLSVRSGGATVVRGGGLALVEVEFAGPAVATLQPGVRGTAARRQAPVTPAEARLEPAPAADAEPTGMLEADPATIDLAEASRIVAGGAGLGSPAVMDLLSQVAEALGCATGATRVVADAGWVPFSRQIGTTGVVVHPELYVAVGISGAVQHTSGVVDARDVVAVNIDDSCPMMSLADLALVTDAPGLVAALAARLGVAGEPGQPGSPQAQGEADRSEPGPDEPAGRIAGVSCA
jgi:electron transfer flavoprotein alpha subunit